MVNGQMMGPKMHGSGLFPLLVLAVLILSLASLPEYLRGTR